MKSDYKFTKFMIEDMLRKLIPIMILPILLSACAGTNSSKGTFIENDATNYLMPKCPKSDITVTQARNEIAPAVLECLGHDDLVNLAGLPGDRPLVISFWASWCTVCAEDAISFNAAYKKLNSKINFLGIAYQDKEKESLAAAYKWQLPFPSVQDPRSLLREYYAIIGLPITLLIDKNGKIIERISGPIGNPENFTNRLTGKLISY